MQDLTRIITATDSTVRNQSLDTLCAVLSLDDLLRQAVALDSFRRQRENLYERVRALFFLYSIHRFHLPGRLAANAPSKDTATAEASVRAGLIPFKGYELFLHPRFEEAL